MFLVIAALENIVKIFGKSIISIYFLFLFDIILIVNIHIFNLCWFEIFLLPSTTLPNSSKLFTDISQVIVLGCFNDFSGSGFKGKVFLCLYLCPSKYCF